jgi:hypothetical protein
MTCLTRLQRARADVRERLTRASGADADALRQTQTALETAYRPLPDLLDMLQDADVKPPPALQTAVDVAVKQALEAVVEGRRIGRQGFRRACTFFMRSTISCRAIARGRRFMRWSWRARSSPGMT